MHEKCDNRQLDFTRTDFTAEIFRRAPHHLACDEYANDEKEQQVNHADALAAEYTVQPHAHHRRKPGERIEAIVGAVHSTASDFGSDCGKGRTGNGAESQFLAFEIAQMLLNRQTRDLRNRQFAETTLCGCTRNLVGDTGRMCGYSTIRFQLEIDR